MKRRRLNGADEAERALLRALRRLSRSNGRLSRVRARRAFQGAARGILAAFPAPGTARRALYRCPICSRPPVVQAARFLVGHLVVRHSVALGSGTTRSDVARLVSLARRGKLEAEVMHLFAERHLGDGNA